MGSPLPPSADVLYQRASAAWPTVALAREDFLAHFQARGARVDGPQALHAADLYLACACARGVPEALALFERYHLSAARQALGRRGLEADVVDEALQRLRERLLVPREGAPPRVAEYDGRGPLDAWVRTVALRLALTELRERAARPAANLDSQLLPAQEASFEALKDRHRADFEAALRSALASLEPQDRAILRLHLVEGVGVEDVGRVHGVSRATMTRWLKSARDTLAARVRAELHHRLRVDSSELHSLAHSLLDHLDDSVKGLLR